MPAPDPKTLERWRTLVVVDRDGTTVGTVGEFYLDRGSGQATWALVNTGLFGSKQTFVPLAEAEERGGELRVPYAKARIRDAPRIEPDSSLSPAEEDVLFAHYGLDHGTVGDQPAGDDVTGPDDDERSAPARPGDDDAMTRSEEELRVGTVRQPRERVRLRKYLVTEEVQVTVPVTREEVRLEREPLGGEAAGDKQPEPKPPG